MSTLNIPRLLSYEEVSRLLNLPRKAAAKAFADAGISPDAIGPRAMQLFNETNVSRIRAKVEDVLRGQASH